MHQLFEAIYWVGGISAIVYLLRLGSNAPSRKSNVEFAAGKMGNLNRVDTPLADYYVNGKEYKPGPLEAGYYHRSGMLGGMDVDDVCFDENRYLLDQGRVKLPVVPYPAPHQPHIVHVHEDRDILDQTREWLEKGHKF